METHLITFNDLEITAPEGICLANGSFVVVYNVCPAEPDVGIMSRYIEINDYHDVEILLDLIDENGNLLSRFVDDTLLPQVIKAYGEDWIVDEIQNSI